jgi:tetratricopeptide (TPR) repeat protein/tRNA A-37 threonylcarbamoyl transferase component Bud32
MAELRDQLQSTLSGSYTLERELGGGGMSRVFLADELRLGRQVVVKVLSPELAAGISAERFEREIRLAASLQQANIVPVLSVGDTNGLPYYTMPYVEGESLRAALASQPPLSISDVVRILGDVARALQYAHERGIVHRDIKPDNVLLSGGTAVVTDFGIAKALSASRTEASSATLTQLGTSIGTPAYMAPEQAAGDPDVDARADIYALGCMAYELLAGRPPFHERTPQRVLAAHMGEAPRPIAELRPDAPDVLGSLVMRMLAKDPGERPQSATEVILALGSVTSGSGMSALPPVLLHGPAAFRRALLVYLGSVAAVAVMAKAATIAIGLPDWVFPGAMLVMALGLPVILFTGYVQRVARRALTATPTLTPGGGAQPRGTMATLALKASPHVSWKRATRGGIYALGAFAVLVIVFMVMRAFGVGPVGSLLAAGKLNQRDPILIADFGVSRADSSVGRVVAEGVRANLSQSSSLTLFSPASVSAALRRMQRDPATRVDAALARQIAAREGLKAIVTGDVTGLGSGFVIALRLVSADSGNVLASYQTTVDDPSELVNGVDEVTRKLRGKIGESLRSVQSSPPLAQVTTSSYEALRAYTDGARAFDAEHDFQKAIPLLRQAVTIDTGFATAWRKLGTAYANAGYPQSLVDSAVTKAFQLRSRLADNERYLVEGYYFMIGPGHDRAKGVAAYQALVARGDSVYAANNLGVGYSSRRDWAVAESYFRLALSKQSGNMIPLPNLVSVLQTEGKWAAADSFLAIGLAQLPNNPALLEMSIGRTFLRGDYARAEKSLDSLDKTTTSADVRQMTRWDLGMMAIMRGRLADGERKIREASAMAQEQGSAGPPIADSVKFVLMDEWFRSEHERSVARLDAAVAALPLSRLPEQDRPYSDLAIAYARAGRPDRARAVLAQARQLSDTALLRFRQPTLHLMLAEIALAEGRPREAVTEFRAGDRAPDGPVGEDPLVVLAQLGRAFDLANEPDSAIAMYEQYLQTGYSGRLGDDVLLLAGIRKRLGELYEAKGDTARATSHYSAFVELWKDADPELQPAVAEVKRRLAALGGEGKK